MSLKYALLENLLTARLDDYTAQTQEITSHGIENIIEKMTQKGSTITKTDTLAVLNSFFEVIEEITEEGETINTDLINTHFSVQGVFEGAADSYDAKQHSLRLNINAGKSLKKVLPNVSLVKTTAAEVVPHILEVKDSISSSINENITAGGVIELVGSMLKIQGENPLNGINFVDSEGVHNKVITLIDNKPARLFALTPDLAPGDYTLQVTTQWNGSSLLNTPRTGVFNKPLTVI